MDVARRPADLLPDLLRTRRDDRLRQGLRHLGASAEAARGFSVATPGPLRLSGAAGRCEAWYRASLSGGVDLSRARRRLVVARARHLVERVGATLRPALRDRH